MLQQTFLDELFKGVTLHEDVFKQVAINVQDRDIGKDNIIHKKVLSAIKRLFKSNTDRLPTLGVIEQMVHSSTGKSVSLSKIINSSSTSRLVLLEQLQDYIIKVRAEQNIHDFVTDFNKNSDIKSIHNLYLGLKDVVDINFSGSTYDYTNPFYNVFDIFNEAQENSINDSRVPFGMLEIDKLCNGGMIAGDTALIIMRSGVGKSTLLKWIGWYASRLKNSVMHFQLEGSKLEVQMKYNQIWTGLTYNQISNGYFGDSRNITVWNAIDGKRVITDKVDYIRYVKTKMDYIRKRFDGYNLEVVSFEEFGSPTMQIVEEKIKDYIVEFNAPPKLILIDSLDLMYPGDGQRYGTDTQGIKMRIQNSSKIIKNLAVKYKTRFIAVAQSANVKKEEWDNPDFALTRSHALGDKNIADSFSFVFTGNRTELEKRNKLIRIYIDKLRDFDGEGKVFELLTSYKYGRAININKVDVENKKEQNKKEQNKKEEQNGKEN